MKKTMFVMMFLLMASWVSADVTIDQMRQSDGDIYHYIELIAGGDIYSNGMVVSTGDQTITYQGDYDPMAPLHKMVDLFEEDDPNSLEFEERNFLQRFMGFMTYLYGYFNQRDEQRIQELEFKVMALELLHTHKEICAASLVTADYYNMTEYTCKSGQKYYNDGNGGWMTIN